MPLPVGRSSGETIGRWSSKVYPKDHSEKLHLAQDGTELEPQIGISRRGPHALPEFRFGL